MTDLSAVLQLRERICQRLRVSPGDAEAEQHLLAWYGFHGDVERYVAERVCSLAAMLAMDTGTARRLQSQPQRWTLMAWALEAVAHTFAAEVAQLRVLLREVSRQPPLARTCPHGRPAWCVRLSPGSRSVLMPMVTQALLGRQGKGSIDARRPTIRGTWRHLTGTSCVMFRPSTAHSTPEANRPGH
jgi:hypothetical protein